MQLDFDVQILPQDCRRFLVNPFDPSRYTHAILAQLPDLLLFLFDVSFKVFAARGWSVSL